MSSDSLITRARAGVSPSQADEAQAAVRRSQRSGEGRVLLVANYASDVGYAWWLMENFWSVIAGEMNSRGRECILAYPEIAEVPRVIRDAPLRLVKMKVSWRFSREVLRFLRAERITSIYLTDWPYVHWTYALWRAAGVRRIVLHDHKPGDRPAASMLKRIVHGAVHATRVGACDHYIGVSSYIGARLQQSTCVPSDRCRVVENGIELFRPESERRGEMRRELGIPQDAILVALVSRATLYKGLDFAIECFAQLRSRSSAWDSIHVVHCGDGPDIEHFRELARRAGVQSQVRFLGRRSDVKQILAAADLAFHPSRGEGLSLSMLEFMCAGLPVVVPDRPSVCAPVIPEETGVLYKAEDVNSATAALSRLIEDAGLRARLGAAAQQRCRERFSLEATNESFRRQVLSLL